MKGLYVVRISSPVPGRGGIRDIDDMHAQITYQFEPYQRKRLEDIKHCLYKELDKVDHIKFFGLRVVREESLSNIRNLVIKYKMEVNQVRDDLDIHLFYFVLPELDMRKGLYINLLAALEEEVYTKLSERLTKFVKENKEFKPISRKTTLRLIRRLKKLNILENVEFDKKMEEIEKLISIQKVEGAADKIEKEIDRLEELRFHRGAFLDI